MPAAPAIAEAAARAAAATGACAVGPARRLRARGAVNWMGLWSLSRRGVMTFFANALSELTGPLITSAMFLAVFVLALDGAGGGDPARTQALSDFVGPGILAFMMAHQAFQHAATLLVMDKTEGVIQDFLMAPLSPLELTLGYVVAAAVTALVIGVLILAIMVVFVGLPLAHPLALLGFAVLGSLLFALVGAVVGLWAEKWEQYSAAESFLILPMGMLSGAFFPLDALAQSWRWAILANPFHHVVEGIRWSIVGGASGSPLFAAMVALALILVLGLLTWRLFTIGYHLKP